MSSAMAERIGAVEICVEVKGMDGRDEVDEDGRVRRRGTVVTATAHIITAVIGSGVLSLAWATAQLGWVGGPVVIVLFSFVTYYSSTLLASCYRIGDPISGKRNYTYMHAVRSHLGGWKVKLCGFIQYLNMFGIGVGYTIASSISMMAVQRSNCFHKGKKRCRASSNRYMVIFGVAEIVLSQIPDFDQIWWLSSVAAVMSFTYSFIGLGLGIAKVAETRRIKGSLTGIPPTLITPTQKTFRSFQALGDIAFSYSFSVILLEIQDSLSSPPSESQTLTTAAAASVAVTTVFYLLSSASGYAAFGNHSPGNLLTGFGFYNPFWLLDLANLAIVVHLLGAYQVYSQPLFSFVERISAVRFPRLMDREITVRLAGGRRFKIGIFRLVWRTVFVGMTTAAAMVMPFFNDVVGLLGALGFWPLTVYFPVEMYIARNKVRRWSLRWICMEILSFGCMVVSAAAAVGSVAGIVEDLRVYRPFGGGA